jgi:hypothetical protein
MEQIQMSETTTQAMHELLLGLNQDGKDITSVLRVMTSQLHNIFQLLADQAGAVGSPALGLCGSHVAEWIAAGGESGAVIPPAQTVFMVQGAGAVPVCLDHFRAMLASVSGSQLLVAQPPMPPSGGLIVPSR